MNQFYLSEIADMSTPGSWYDPHYPGNFGVNVNAMVAQRNVCDKLFSAITLLERMKIHTQNYTHTNSNPEYSSTCFSRFSL